MKYLCVSLIERKIACNYLHKQYKQAKCYLEKAVKNGCSKEELNIICERVNRAGVAYAQAKCCVFIKGGSYGENLISRLNNNNKVISFSEYQVFIDEMESYIRDVIN